MEPVESSTWKHRAKNIALGVGEIALGIGATYAISRGASHWYKEASTHDGRSFSLPVAAVAGTTYFMLDGLHRVFDTSYTGQVDKQVHKAANKLMHEHGHKIAPMAHSLAAGIRQYVSPKP